MHPPWSRGPPPGGPGRGPVVVLLDSFAAKLIVDPAFLFWNEEVVKECNVFRLLLYHKVMELALIVLGLVYYDAKAYKRHGVSC